jgi:ATP-dependent protease ClpP protease subunit
MEEITLTGEIGWEIDSYRVRRILAEANGEDIVVNFSSPGGYVFEGFEIFNLFKNYGGNVDFHLIGEAASMGSYIPLSGRKITAEANVVYMIHNASGCVCGDHNRFIKVAGIIQGLSKIIAQEYMKKTGKTEKEITSMMDEETYFFGAETVEAGFIDQIVGEEDKDPDAKNIHIAVAKESFFSCMKKVQEEKTDDYEKLAAMIPEEKIKNNVSELALDDKQTACGGTTKRGTMDLSVKKLKAENRDVYDEVVEIGKQIERKNSTAHLIMGEKSGDMATAIKAIKEGAEMDAIHQAQYMTAGMNKADIQARGEDNNDAGDNVSDDTSADTGDQVVAKVKEILGYEEVPRV